MKWIGTQTIYDSVRFKKDIDIAGDVTFYQPVNNADPTISIGSSDDERLQVAVLYTGTTTQTAQIVSFATFTESTTAHDGRFHFAVDGTRILKIQDDGINLSANMGIAINDVDILTNAGTGATTLSNINTLDATTVATLNAALTAGDITGVTAGTGLSGGGTSGAVTLNVDAAQTQITSVGTIGTGVWQGTAINQTYLVGQSGTNTGDEDQASINALGITTVGSVDTGRWQGDVVASAYLDADTAHLSGAQTFTGTKTLNSFKGTAGATVTNILDEDAMGSNSATALATQQSIKAYIDSRAATQKQLTYYMFRADIDTTKTYVGLQEADGESTSASNKNLPILAPVAGKLLKVFLRANNDLSGKELTWRLETHSSSSATSGTPTVVGTLSGSGCTASSMTTYDFTEVDSNAIVAGDTVQLSIESDGTTANTTYFITCLWEWDLS